MDKVDTNPGAYLAQLPEDVRDAMTTLDALIVAGMPGCTRTLWQGTFWGGTDQTIVGYGDITQPRPRGPDVEWFAIGLARQKRHYSLYVNVVDDGQYLTKAYADRLGNVKVGSASIGFNRLDDIDLDAFRELIAHVHRLTAQ